MAAFKLRMDGVTIYDIRTLCGLVGPLTVTVLPGTVRLGYSAVLADFDTSHEHISSGEAITIAAGATLYMRGYCAIRVELTSEIVPPPDVQPTPVGGKGDPGKDGTNGADGLTAYNLTVYCRAPSNMPSAPAQAVNAGTLNTTTMVFTKSLLDNWLQTAPSMGASVWPNDATLWMRTCVVYGKPGMTALAVPSAAWVPSIFVSTMPDPNVTPYIVQVYTRTDDRTAPASNTLKDGTWNAPSKTFTRPADIWSQVPPSAGVYPVGSVLWRREATVMSNSSNPSVNLYQNNFGPATIMATSGANGVDGAKGDKGTDGAKGTDGTNGTNGLKGDKGDPGGGNVVIESISSFGNMLTNTGGGNTNNWLGVLTSNCNSIWMRNTGIATPLPGAWRPQGRQVIIRKNNVFNNNVHTALVGYSTIKVAEYPWEMLEDGSILEITAVVAKTNGANSAATITAQIGHNGIYLAGWSDNTVRAISSGKLIPNPATAGQPVMVRACLMKQGGSLWAMEPFPDAYSYSPATLNWPNISGPQSTTMVNVNTTPVSGVSMNSLGILLSGTGVPIAANNRVQVLFFEVAIHPATQSS